MNSQLCQVSRRQNNSGSWQLFSSLLSRTWRTKSPALGSSPAQVLQTFSLPNTRSRVLSATSELLYIEQTCGWVLQWAAANRLQHLLHWRFHAASEKSHLFMIIEKWNNSLRHPRKLSARGHLHAHRNLVSCEQLPLLGEKVSKNSCSKVNVPGRRNRTHISNFANDPSSNWLTLNRIAYFCSMADETGFFSTDFCFPPTIAFLVSTFISF